MNFLTLDDLYQIHQDQLARYGGQDGIRDQKALESAIAQPQASFGGEYLHPTVFDMAAAYTYHIAQNQPFVDGNKRAGLVAGLTFLYFHDYEVIDPKMELPEAVESFPGKKPDPCKADFAALLRKLSRRLSSDDAQ